MESTRGGSSRHGETVGGHGVHRDGPRRRRGEDPKHPRRILSGELDLDATLRNKIEEGVRELRKLKGKMIEQSGGRDGGYGGRNQRNTADRVSVPTNKYPAASGHRSANLERGNGEAEEGIKKEETPLQLVP